jgi:ADP-ribose pyrophosphatase YjhB (NUDIX family)
MEKETLEEAAERIAKEHCNIRVNPNTTEFQVQQFIIKGAYWQQERMYSEEEVLEFANWCRIQDNKHPNRVITIQQLFEQFKKK